MSLTNLISNKVIKRFVSCHFAHGFAIVAQTGNLQTTAYNNVKFTKGVDKIYNIGFALACCISLFIGCAGAAVLIANGLFDPVKYKTTLDLLSSIGSFLGGIAGVVAASAAYIGVNVWKKQLTYGKYMALIWSCMECLREFQQKYTHWQIIAFAYGTNKIGEIEDLKIIKIALESAMENLSSQCNSLDKIVVKNQWLWANYASFLKVSVVELEKAIKENRENPINIFEFNDVAAQLNSNITNQINFLEQELEKLESKYQ